MSKLKEQIRKILRNSSQIMTIRELKSHFDNNRKTTVGMYCAEMARDGEITRTSLGCYKANPLKPNHGVDPDPFWEFFDKGMELLDRKEGKR